MKKVVFEIRSHQEFMDDLIHQIESGNEENCAHYAFPTQELYLEVFRKPRLAIVKSLCGVGPVPISDITRKTGFHRADVEALIQNGILDEKIGGMVEFPFEEIEEPILSMT